MTKEQIAAVGLVGLLLCIGLVLLSFQNATLRAEIAGLQKLPSISAIQRRVGATPDGRLGRETQEKWDKAYCQQSADRWINDKTMGIEK